MKTTIYIIIAFTFMIACSNKSSEIRNVVNSAKEITDYADFVDSSINEIMQYNSVILIEINSEIKLNWDNSTSKIVEDDHWKKLISSYQSKKKTLIQEVSNQELTNAKVCKVDGNLTKGQMAFIVLDQLEDIPYASVFKNQYCVRYIDCPYIGRLIESIENNKHASEQLMNFFYN